MSDDRSPTPPDHLVIGLRIDVSLLPGWFDEVKALADRFVRRMEVVERPAVWIVRCELPRARVGEFHDALQAAWTRYRASEADGTTTDARG